MRTLVVLGLLLAGCTPAPRVAPGAPVVPAVAAAVERGLLPAVQVRGEPVARRALADRMRELRIPGLSIAVFERGQVVWAQAYGVTDRDTGAPVTTETLFQAGSISKTANALAVLLEADAGRLDLDAPINQALGRWKLPDSEPARDAPVTLRRILSHTAGLTVHGFPGYPTGAALPTVPQILDGAPPANTAAVRVDVRPGTIERYAGGGTTISQLALTDTLRAPYPEILENRVLAPLGMVHSTFAQPLPADLVVHAAAGHLADGSVVPTKRHVYPEMAAAGLWTTPTDLARMFAEIGRARSGRSTVLPRTVARAMTTVSPPSSGGLGVFLSERHGAQMFGHGGADAGFQASSVASLDGGYGVIVMANSDNGFEIFPEIERTVFAAYGWAGRDPELVRVALDPGQRDAWLGRYDASRVVFELVADGDGVAYVEPFMAPRALIPTTDGLRDSRYGTAFERTTDGLRLGRGRQQVAAVRVAAGQPVPLLDLAAGRRDVALAGWRTLIAAAPPAEVAAGEDRANRHGYALLREGKPREALAVFGLIAEVFPASSNAADSHAESAAAAGDVALAIREYERALALLAADAQVPAPEKPGRRRLTEAQLAALRARAATAP